MRLWVGAVALLSASPVWGQLLCGEQQVNQYVTSVQGTPAIAADPAGGFVITWASTGSYGTDSSDRSIQARRVPRQTMSRSSSRDRFIPMRSCRPC